MKQLVGSDGSYPAYEEKIRRNGIVALAVALCLFHLYTAGFGMLSMIDQRAIHWIGFLSAVFLAKPTKIKFGLVVDLIIIALLVASGIHLMIQWRGPAAMGLPISTSLDYFFAVVAIVLTIESARRTTGWALPIVCMLALLYLFFGENLPPDLAHRGYSFMRIGSFLYFTTEGIYGFAIGVSATIIIVFVIFGLVLNASGGGKFFLDIVLAMVGRFRGGAAKAAVFASALFGTISGSPMANVVTTGTFTIPAMKQTGYKPHVAGAIEAVASTGGQIMPPIMGAAAFIMAEFTGIPYGTIALSAIIPALMYFFCVYLMVDIEAIQEKIKGLPKESLPDMRQTFKDGWHTIPPLVTLIYLVLGGFSVTLAAFYSTVFLVVVWLLKTRKLVEVTKKLIRAFSEVVENIGSVVAACAAAGIIVGAINLTGIGMRMSTLVGMWGGGDLLFTLFLAMVVSLILGMGLPTAVVYIVTATIIAPVLVELGVPILVAHMFVFYFGCISTITPPVALTAFGAAGVAKANANLVGYTAFKYGIAAYIVPFMFVYGPELLLLGNPAHIPLAVVTVVIGAISLACAAQGWLLNNIGPLERLLLLGCALLMIDVYGLTTFIGMGLFAALILVQVIRRRKLKDTRSAY